MHRTRTLAALAAVAALNTACVVFSGEGALTIAPERLVVGNVVSTSGNVTLESGSRVTGCVFLTSGTLTIAPGAEVWGDVIMTSGTIRLTPASVVRGQIVYTSGTVEWIGARVDGGVSRDVAGWAAASVLKYCALPACLLLVLLAGIVFAFARKKPPVPEPSP